MSKLNIKSKSKGFTIVELLVVIVVIGILAAITIVSYTGITARANTSSAKANAGTVLERLNIYLTEKSTTVYPNFATLKTTWTTSEGTASSIGALTDITAKATDLASSDKPSVIQYKTCATIADPTVITGVQIIYFDYSASPAAAATPLTHGVTTGNCTANANS